MENKIKEMIDYINNKITYANKNFTEWNASHERRMAEIDGMVKMLSIATGKDYIITEHGLVER